MSALRTTRNCRKACSFSAGVFDTMQSEGAMIARSRM
jgi:hypothetical protein